MHSQALAEGFQSETEAPGSSEPEESDTPAPETANPEVSDD